MGAHGRRGAADKRIETLPLARFRPCTLNAKGHGANQVVKIGAGMARIGRSVPRLMAGDGGAAFQVHTPRSVTPIN